ncbi:MAG: ribonuclease [Chloroflexota bacterium]|nr:ribonuclease [Chloroflexota bacterium]
MARTRIEKINVYTDGSCEPNPGPGGWAAIILDGKKETVLKGFEKASTNNRMELTAAIEALRAIDPAKPVILYTDSQYLKNGVEKWLRDWQSRNWKRRGGVLLNVDLWKQVAQVIQGRKITWRWVKGHNGNPYNERVDRLAHHMMKSRG